MTDKPTILVVDDEQNIRRILEASFTKKGYNVITAENGRIALDALSKNNIDIVLSDVVMPDINGAELLQKVKETKPDLPVVLITAYGAIPQAVQAIQGGAYDYLTKPFDLDMLSKLVQKAVTLHKKADRAKPSNGKKNGKTVIIGNTAKMQEIIALLDKISDSKATVLINGESGTGKELIAKALHERSSRADKPFVAVSCAALPETLLESELFGHEKGAFTGADHQKAGRFELAHHGTLFLDEIGDIPASIQVKLLRVLQEREFERLGSAKPIKVDVRLVTATNRDLNKAVEQGIFRGDLYYRLQVIQIELPPLRERKADIPELCRFFIQKYNKDNCRKIEDVSAEALDYLNAYDWPGNIRELENTVERAIVLSDEKAKLITPDLLPPHIVKT